MGASRAERTGVWPPAPVMVVVLGVALVLFLAGGRYGFHRDELYLVEAGRHPGLAYPDQPAAVPLLAAWWYDVVQGNLRWFRVLPAAAAAVVVLAAGLTSRTLGGDRHDQLWTALVTGTATTLLAAGHLFSTTAFDMALTSLAVWLLARALVVRTAVAWLLTGLLIALALTVKVLPLVVLGCCVLALLLVGPRDVLRTRGPWLAGLVATLGLAPTLAWQAVNGWPQLDMAASIGGGGSGTSVQRWLLVPMLPTLTGATFVLVAVGAVMAWRARPLRWVAVAGVLLVVALVLTGGKPYYAFGLVPLLAAVGVPAARRWETARPRRRGLLAGLVALNAVASVLIALPVLPPQQAPTALVHDHGEQVGWDDLVGLVTGVATDADADLVLTENYGQAGALDQARRLGSELPPVASGHVGYWWWSRPTGEPERVVVVGYGSDRGAEWFARCTVVATVRNDEGVVNDEAGAPVQLCSGPLEPWADLWPQLRRTG